MRRLAMRISIVTASFQDLGDISGSFWKSVKYPIDQADGHRYYYLVEKHKRGYYIMQRRTSLFRMGARGLTGTVLALAITLTSLGTVPTLAASQDTSSHHKSPRICRPGRGGEVTEGTQTFTSEGLERTYLLSLPKGYNGKKPKPLIFNFHGGGGTKERQEAYTAMGERGSARGYIVVTPQALGSPAGWNLFSDPTRANDYGLVDALITDLSERLCVDEDRVYAAGHSNGSAFTGLLACRPPHQFAGVAMVAAFIPPEYSNCPAGGKAPSIVAFHGTEDPGIPYEGGFVEGITVGGTFFIPGVRDTLDNYADHYDCKPHLKENTPAQNVVRHRYDKCTERSRLALYSIIGGGHEWPGGITPQTSTHKHQFSATKAILDFFDKHKK